MPSIRRRDRFPPEIRDNERSFMHSDFKQQRQDYRDYFRERGIVNDGMTSIFTNVDNVSVPHNYTRIIDPDGVVALEELLDFVGEDSSDDGVVNFGPPSPDGAQSYNIEDLENMSDEDGGLNFDGEFY